MSSSRWTSARREFPNTGFKLLDPSVPIEEEMLPTYIPEKYYPVQQGEIFHGRYQALVKLGYGTTSTIWLSRDLVESRYVALKVYVTGNKHNNHEVETYEHLNSIQVNHPGPRLIRKLLDHFSIQGPHGCHTCLVHELLGTSIINLMNFLPERKMTFRNMKRCIRQPLVAVDFLHHEANISHTGNRDVWQMLGLRHDNPEHVMITVG